MHPPGTASSRMLWGLPPPATRQRHREAPCSHLRPAAFRAPGVNEESSGRLIAVPGPSGADPFEVLWLWFLENIGDSSSRIRN